MASEVLADDQEYAVKQFIDICNNIGSSTCNVRRNISRSTAIIFLHASKFDVPRAVALYEQHEQIRLREGLYNINPDIEPLSVELQTGKFTILSSRDPSGAAIALFIARKHNPQYVTHATTLQGIVYQLDCALQNVDTQRAGLVFIYDMTGSKYSNFDYELSQKILTLLKGGYPARLKKVLIVTAPLWFRAPFKILRLFVREKLRDRVYTVSVPTLSLHIPRKSLPVHLGGTLQIDNATWLLHCRKSMTNREDELLANIGQPALNNHTGIGTGFGGGGASSGSTTGDGIGTISPVNGSGSALSSPSPIEPNENSINTIKALLPLANGGSSISAAAAAGGAAITPTDNQIVNGLVEKPALVNGIRPVANGGATIISSDNVIGESGENIIATAAAASGPIGGGGSGSGGCVVGASALGVASTSNEFWSTENPPSSASSGFSDDDSLAGQEGDPKTIEQIVQMVKSLGRGGLMKEYAAIRSRAPEGTFVHAKMRNNLTKNRYTDVLCYDHTRVVLSQEDGDENSDYINANFVDGYKQKNAYISTQGPLPKTSQDFWRMIWEQHCQVIVMTTRVMERGRVKCGQYWEPNEDGCLEFGNFQVRTISVETNEDYTVASLQLKNLKTDEERCVSHWQFTNWPDYGVPRSAMAMLNFLQKVRAKQAEMVKALGDKWMGHVRGPPIVVHCSAGIGRTGTFITLDICISRLEDVGTADIRGTVEKIRSQRAYSIQMPDQYVFCHLALIEYAISRGMLKSADLAGFDDRVDDSE